jgi:DNA-directed RNA polymerase specialized sigma24 family protein
LISWLKTKRINNSICIPTPRYYFVSKGHIGFMQTEKDLIEDCLKEKRAAQKALYDRYCRKMMVVCQRYAKSSQEAEDILQEGFIKVFATMVDVDGIDLREDEQVSLSGFHLNELIAIVQSLPDGCRLVFNLFAIEGYSHKEIGEMLTISEGTSKSQYNRAKSLLKVRISQQEKRYEKFGEGKV